LDPKLKCDQKNVAAVMRK